MVGIDAKIWDSIFRAGKMVYNWKKSTNKSSVTAGTADVNKILCVRVTMATNRYMIR